MVAWWWILIAVVVLLAIAVIGVGVMRKRRTTALRERFGAEYDRTVQTRQGQRAAEADLRYREKQRSKLDISPLPEPARARFSTEWRGVQEQFVDQPPAAVAAADDLVYRVMGARGYPMDDFDAQADLVSVDHPEVVENYRNAHRIYELSQSQEARTEDLRSALLHYRSLFDELLCADEHATGPSGGGQPTAVEPDHQNATMERDGR